MQSICASHSSCVTCLPCKTGAQFTWFTTIQVQILTRACRAELPLDFRCSVYLLYWYKGTNTDARLQSSTAARPVRSPAFHCLRFFFFFFCLPPFFLFFFSPLDLYVRPLFTVAVTRAGVYHFTCFTGARVQIPTLLFRHRRRASVAAVSQALSYKCMLPYATSVCGLTLQYNTADGVLLWLLYLRP